MSYERFSIDTIETEFGVAIRDHADLYADTAPVEPSSQLTALLADYVPLGSAIGTEKARSEFIIAPILAEVKKRAGGQVSLFSGTRFDVDRERGLTGFCDFLFSFSSSQLALTAPVVTVVEAKNENINAGLGQCMAEMIAAQLYNKNRGKPLERIHGCITTGSLWRFLQLRDRVLVVDSREYYLDQLARILGIFLSVLVLRS